MQKGTRRPHGIRSRKISVSVSEEDLAVLSARARRMHRGNLSAVVHDMVVALKREQALDELLGMLGGDRVTETEMLKLRQEIAAAKPGARRRRPAA
jgi:hypothetical protein